MYKRARGRERISGRKEKGQILAGGREIRRIPHDFRRRSVE